MKGVWVNENVLRSSTKVYLRGVPTLSEGVYQLAFLCIGVRVLRENRDSCEVTKSCVTVSRGVRR